MGILRSCRAHPRSGSAALAEPAAPPSDDDASPTLRVSVAEWLELQTTQLQPSTCSSDQSVLGRYLLAQQRFADFVWDGRA